MCCVFSLYKDDKKNVEPNSTQNHFLIITRFYCEFPIK